MMMHVSETVLSASFVVGIFMATAGLAIAINPKQYKKIVDDFFKSPALLMVGAMMALLFGSVLLVVHNEWMKHWTVLLTILGWLSLIKGVLLFLSPDSLKNLSKDMSKNMGLIQLVGFIYFAVGLFLLYKGYPVL